ncbi:MAG: hypothetical protein ACREEW_15950, partial [Caulobacteraceae bacterium]
YGAIRKGFVAPWLEASHGQNLVVRDVILAAASAYAAGGYEVVVDGVVGPWFLDAYREAAARLGASLDYVVLRPDRETAVVRARDRAEAPLPDYPAGLYEKFADLGPLEPHAIDGARRGVETLAETVRSGIVAGRFRLD